MNKKNNPKIKYIGLLILVVMVLQACSPAVPVNKSEESQIQSVNEDSAVDLEKVEEPSESTDEMAISEDSSETEIEISSAASGLTDDEITGLIFMREEEKLARDVYLGLYDIWGLSIFQNIANSEQTHTDAVKNLLDNFEIEDPVDTSPAGVFVNEDLQQLYNDLMALGSQSLGDALLVGGAIEEIDILDLQENLEVTENQEIQNVYENLLGGSKNHLQAFTSNFERQTGENYQPQYLSQAEYDAIVGSSSVRGGQGKANRP